MRTSSRLHKMKSSPYLYDTVNLSKNHSQVVSFYPQAGRAALDFVLSVNTACYVISVRRFWSLPVIFLLTLGFFVAAHIGRTAKNQVAA